MEPTFSYTFDDLRKDVLEYQGVGRETEDSDKIAKAGRRVNDAYRNFLALDWTFLTKSAIITLEAGKYEYELPDDFAVIRTSFKQVSQAGFFNPTQVTQSYLLQCRSYYDSSGYPLVYSVTTKYHEGEGLRYVVSFYPTPNTTVGYHYEYKVTPNELVDSEDIPYCPPNLSHVLRAYCLAEVEQFDEEGSKITWTNKLFNQLLPVAINENSVRSPSTVGSMNIPSIYFPRPFHTASGNDVTVNGETYNI